MSEYLYRAVYTDEHGRIRPMTFAAIDQKAADDFAEQWKLRGETVSAVRMLRRLSHQLVLAPSGSEAKAA